MLSERARCETINSRGGKTVYWGALEIDEVDSADDLNNISVGTVATFTTINSGDEEGVPFGTELPLIARRRCRKFGTPTGIWRFQVRRKISAGVHTYKIEKIQ